MILTLLSCPEDTWVQDQSLLRYKSRSRSLYSRSLERILNNYKCPCLVASSSKIGFSPSCLSDLPNQPFCMTLPGLEGTLLHKASFPPSLDHLRPNQPLPTHADLPPGSSFPFIGQLLAPPPQEVTGSSGSELRCSEYTWNDLLSPS